jgi:hypothetical protein
MLSNVVTDEKIRSHRTREWNTKNDGTADIVI